MFDLNHIVEKYGHEADVLEKTGLDAQVLEAIYNDHVYRKLSLEAEADRLASLLRRAPGVHSIKARIKDEEHLIDKILRKRMADPSREFSVETYRYQIDDLIGLRALHLFKNQWYDIHQFVMEDWDLKEPPTAYHRAGDAEDRIKEFEGSGCQTKIHPAHYRSVHYILLIPLSKGRTATAELQVRTLFEEGWGEVDHLVRYPNNTENEMINTMSALLNRVAGVADEMNEYLSLVKNEVDFWEAQKYLQQRKYKDSQEALSQAHRQLQEILDKTALNPEEKRDIQEKVQELDRLNDPQRDVPSFASQVKERFPWMTSGSARALAAAIADGGAGYFLSPNPMHLASLLLRQDGPAPYDPYCGSFGFLDEVKRQRELRAGSAQEEEEKEPGVEDASDNGEESAD